VTSQPTDRQITDGARRGNQRVEHTADPVEGGLTHLGYSLDTAKELGIRNFLSPTEND
jgi:hypothetical protein